MFYLILLILLCIGVYLGLDFLFTKFPVGSAFVVRWCGSLSILFFGLFAYALSHTVGPRVQGMMWGWIGASFATLFNFKCMVIIMGEAKRKERWYLMILSFFAHIACIFPPTAIMCTLIRKHFYPDYEKLLN